MLRETDTPNENACNSALFRDLSPRAREASALTAVQSFTMAPTTSTTSKAWKQPKKTLGSLLPYFVGRSLTVEQKTGRLYTGTLTGASDAMDLTLENAVRVFSGSQGRRRRSSNDNHSSVTTSTTTTTSSSPLLFQVLHIRGSTIRYIHFDNIQDLGVVIKQGMDRERSATQRYERGVRKR